MKIRRPWYATMAAKLLLSRLPLDVLGTCGAVYGTRGLQSLRSLPAQSAG